MNLNITIIVFICMFFYELGNKEQKNKKLYTLVSEVNLSCSQLGSQSRDKGDRKSSPEHGSLEETRIKNGR